MKYYVLVVSDNDTPFSNRESKEGKWFVCQRPTDKEDRLQLGLTPVVERLVDSEDIDIRNLRIPTDILWFSNAQLAMEMLSYLRSNPPSKISGDAPDFSSTDQSGILEVLVNAELEIKSGSLVSSVEVYITHFVSTETYEHVNKEIHEVCGLSADCCTTDTCNAVEGEDDGATDK